MSEESPPIRRQSYGQHGLDWLDRWGTWLSRRPVMRAIRRYPRPVVLDLGCGYEARLLQYLQAHIEKGVGVDVKIAPNIRSNPRLEFLEQPIDQALLTLKDRRFDVIMLISVLEHLWEPRRVLGDCRALLNPGGSLVINVPNWRGKCALELSAFKIRGLQSGAALEMDDHKMYYNKRDLWPLLVAAGFKPSRLRLRYHKLGLNLFAVARAP